MLQALNLQDARAHFAVRVQTYAKILTPILSRAPRFRVKHLELAIESFALQIRPAGYVYSEAGSHMGVLVCMK